MEYRIKKEVKLMAKRLQTQLSQIKKMYLLGMSPKKLTKMNIDIFKPIEDFMKRLMPEGDTMELSSVRTLKIKLVHFIKDKYYIEYSEDGVCWNLVHEWLDPDRDNPTRMKMWSGLFGTETRMRAMAEKFKTIEDVKRYEAIQESDFQYSMRIKDEYEYKMSHMPRIIDLF